MNLSQIRREVEALMCKYATELELYRMRPHALQFCDEMTGAVTGPITGPGRPVLEWAHAFFQRLQEHGFRLRTFMGLSDYLERCLDRRVLPQVNEVLRSLLPKAVAKGLIPRSSYDPVPIPDRQPALDSGPDGEDTFAPYEAAEETVYGEDTFAPYEAAEESVPHEQTETLSLSEEGQPPASCAAQSNVNQVEISDDPARSPFPHPDHISTQHQMSELLAESAIEPLRSALPQPAPVSAQFQMA